MRSRSNKVRFERARFDGAAAIANVEPGRGASRPVKLEQFILSLILLCALAMAARVAYQRLREEEGDTSIPPVVELEQEPAPPPRLEAKGGVSVELPPQQPFEDPTEFGDPEDVTAPAATEPAAPTILEATEPLEANPVEAEPPPGPAPEPAPGPTLATPPEQQPDRAPPVTATAQRVTLELSVLDESGEPLAGGFAELARPGPAGPEVFARQAVGKDGRARFANLSKGRYEVAARGDGFAHPFQAVDVTGAEPAPAVALHIERPASVRGTVLDETGAPLRGAAVELHLAGVAAGSATSGPDGSFRIDGVRVGAGARAELVARAESRPDRPQIAVDLAPGRQAEAGPLAFAARKSELFGRLLGPDREVLTAARIELISARGERAATTASDDSGVFRLGGVDVGEYRVRCPGYCLNGGPTLAVRVERAGELVDCGPITVEPSAPLRGNLRGDDGTALAGAEVRLGERKAEVAATGDFEIARCGGGAADLEVRYVPPGEPAAVLSRTFQGVGSGGRAARLLLPGSGVVLVVAKDEPGLIGPVTVTARGPSGTLERTFAKVGTLIRITDPLAAGEWRFEVEAAGLPKGLATALLPVDLSEAELRVPVSLRP